MEEEDNTMEEVTEATTAQVGAVASTSQVETAATSANISHTTQVGAVATPEPNQSQQSFQVRHNLKAISIEFVSAEGINIVEDRPQIKFMLQYSEFQGKLEGEGRLQAGKNRWIFNVVDDKFIDDLTKIKSLQNPKRNTNYPINVKALEDDFE